MKKKADKKDIKEIVKEYRKAYPDKNLYFTEDGNCFLHINPCKDHATKTKQKWFEDEPPKKVVKDDQEIELTEEQAKTELAALEINDATDYNKAKELVKVLNLKPKSNKKIDVFEALTAAKEALSSE